MSTRYGPYDIYHLGHELYQVRYSKKLLRTSEQAWMALQ